MAYFIDSTVRYFYIKNQVNEAKEMMKVDKKSNLIFLKHNPKYPNNKTIDDMPLCKVEPLFDCNGMCGINDLSERSQTELQLNFEEYKAPQVSLTLNID